MKFAGSEADLCESFAGIARGDAWTVFPEVAGFDVVLVGADGYQLAVHAKLRPSVEVLHQAMGHFEYPNREHPDEVAVLVPAKPSVAFRAIAARLGVRAFALDALNDDEQHVEAGWGQRPVIDRRQPAPPAPAKRLWLPPVPLQGPGGKASPRVLSPWRVAALRICRRLRAGEPVYRSTFRAAGITESTWLARDWIRGSSRKGPCGTVEYVPGPSFDTETGPDHGYEAERDALPPWAPDVAPKSVGGAP